MNLEKLINSERINCHVETNSKKRSLETASDLISTAYSQLTGPEVFECLLARERLGSTGIGHGVAIPHGRCKNITEALGAFIQLNHGIDYDAIDRKPVDLLFALLVPEDSTQEHLSILAKLAMIFKNDQIRETLRNAKDNLQVMNILTKAWMDD